MEKSTVERLRGWFAIERFTASFSHLWTQINGSASKYQSPFGFTLAMHSRRTVGALTSLLQVGKSKLFRTAIFKRLVVALTPLFGGAAAALKPAMAATKHWFATTPNSGYRVFVIAVAALLLTKLAYQTNSTSIKIDDDKPFAELLNPDSYTTEAATADLATADAGSATNEALALAEEIGQHTTTTPTADATAEQQDGEQLQQLARQLSGESPHGLADVLVEQSGVLAELLEELPASGNTMPPPANTAGGDLTRAHVPDGVPSFVAVDLTANGDGQSTTDNELLNAGSPNDQTLASGTSIDVDNFIAQELSGVSGADLPAEGADTESTQLPIILQVAPYDVVKDFHIPPRFRDESFAHYEQKRYNEALALHELDKQVFLQAPVAQLDINRTGDAYIDTLLLNRLGYALHKEGEDNAAAHKMQQSAETATQIDDPAWRVVARADRATTLHRLGKQADSELEFDHARQLYDGLENPVYRVVAATDFASRLLQADQHGKAMLRYDNAVDAIRDLAGDILTDEGNRYLALSEASNSLGRRSTQRLVRMQQPYFKTVTSLTISSMLYRQSQLSDAQAARREANLGARQIEDETLLAYVKPRLFIVQ